MIMLWNHIRNTAKI